MQESKAPAPITELPIMALVSPVHPLNTQFPMFLTELGISTLVRPWQEGYSLLGDYQYYAIKKVESGFIDSTCISKE